MKVLIDTLPIKVGGGLVKAEALLNYLDESNAGLELLVITSKNNFFINKRFKQLKFKVLKNDLYSINEHFKAKKELLFIEKDFNPDFVFSLFGPTLWRPKSPHLSGYAIPHYVYPESPFFKKQKVIPRLKHFFRRNLKLFLFRKNSDFYWTESHDVSIRLAKLLSVDKDRVFTVSPRNHQIFDGYEFFKSYNLKDTFRLLTISAYYPHKNFEIFPQVIEELRKLKPSCDVKFVTTLKDSDFKRLVSNKSFNEWENIGSVKIEECINLYEKADAVFLPTLLESFSASYTEAMQTKTPIITSDLPFAHYCCQNAALFVDPLNARAIAKSILELMNNPKRREVLVNNGIQRLTQLKEGPRPEQNYFEIMQEIYERLLK